MANLDPRGTAIVDPGGTALVDRRNSFPLKEPLQARSIHHLDVLQAAKTKLDAPQAVAYEAEAQFGLASCDDEDLQDGASLKHEGKITVMHDIEAEAELPKVGECGAAWYGLGVREPPYAEIEAGERGAAEYRGGETQV
jgi:hypothetical protein